MKAPPDAKLIEEHLPLVRMLAKKLASHLPSHIELDDLISAGTIGLIDAASKFEPQFKNTFKTYAEHRIRGAMLDDLRDNDWAPRSFREQQRPLEAARRALENWTGEAPACNAADLAGIGVGEIHEIDRLSQFQNLSPIAEIDVAGFGPSPADLTLLRQWRRKLEHAISRLPAQEATVIRGYYFEQKSQPELAREMGKSEGRVHQIGKRGLERLREILGRP